MPVRSLLLGPLLGALAIGLAACGDEAAGERPAPKAAAAAGPERYCSLTRELDRAGESVFSRLGRDATPEEYEAAERVFIDRFRGKLAQVERAAPPAVRADVQALLAAQRMRAGLEPGARVDEKSAQAAEKRLHAYERRHCGA